MERYVDCERCGERFVGEEVIASYISESRWGCSVCSRCMEEERQAIAEQPAERKEVNQ